MQQTLFLMKPIIQKLSGKTKILKIFCCENYPGSHSLMIRHWSPTRMLLIQTCTIKTNRKLHAFWKENENITNRTITIMKKLITSHNLSKLDYLLLHIKQMHVDSFSDLGLFQICPEVSNLAQDFGFPVWAASGPLVDSVHFTIWELSRNYLGTIQDLHCPSAAPPGGLKYNK